MRLLDLASIDLSNQPGQLSNAWIHAGFSFHLKHSPACVVLVRLVSWLTWHDLIRDLYFFVARESATSVGGGTAGRSGATLGDETVAEPLMLSRWPAPRPPITDWIMDDLAWTNYSCGGQIGLLTERDNETTSRTADHAVRSLCDECSWPPMMASYVEARTTPWSRDRHNRRSWPISLWSAASKTSSSSTLLLLLLHIYHLLQ